MIPHDGSISHSWLGASPASSQVAAFGGADLLGTAMAISWGTSVHTSPGPRKQKPQGLLEP